MKLNAVRSLAIACLLTGPPAVQAQPPFLVADLNVDAPPLQYWDQRDKMETAGGLVYFAADDGIHGKELWASDGTFSGSYLVRDVCPGACSASPASLIDFGGILYFVADDGVHGREIWHSDGTEDGTGLMTDLNPGLGDGVVSLARTGGGPSIFGVLAPTHPLGQEPFLTDGTAAGTQLMGDLNPGPAGSNPRLLGVNGPRTLFVASDADHGAELWAWNADTLQATMVMDINPGTSFSINPAISPASVQGADAIASPKPGAILFTADDGVHGPELWISDGTDDGTYLLKEISAGPAGSYPLGYTAVNGAVYFSATGPEGHELWKTDGTAAGTTLVKDIFPGTPGSAPQELTAVGNLLFFLAYDPTFGEQLFRSDGAAAGTFRLQSPTGNQIAFGNSPPSYGRHGLSALNGKLVFLADSPGGVLLWTSDGTSAGTLFGTVVNNAAIQMADGYAVLGGNFYFRQGTQGQEVWRSNGTAPGTARVHDGSWVTSSFYLDGAQTHYPDIFAAFGGKLYFAAYDGTEGEQLWKSDGTAAGTSKLENIAPSLLRPLASRLVFSNLGSLWSTDGTPEGAQTLPGFTLELTTLGNAVYFANSGAGQGTELWKTDGTPAGTGLVADLVPGSAPSRPSLLTAVGGKLFFQASNEAVSGAELWVSDGTAAGSVQVADLVPGTGSSAPENLTAAGNLLFFTARTSGFGRELWKSDGTGAGTVLVKDINSGAASSNPGDPVPETFAAPAGGPLFFVANDGVHGEELWKSDGTGAGTLLVKDISAGAPGAQPRHLTAAGSKVFFVAADSAGRELWVSDGTDDRHSPGEGHQPRPGILKPRPPDRRRLRAPLLRLRSRPRSGGVADRRHGGGDAPGHRHRARPPLLQPAGVHRRGGERLLRGQRQYLRLRALGRAAIQRPRYLRGRADHLLGLALHRGGRHRRHHPRLRRGTVLHRTHPHPGRDGGLPRPRPARLRLRAAAGHRHPLRGRSSLLLGRRLDRADRHRRRHPGVRRLAPPLLPGSPGRPRRDGDLPAPRPPRRQLRAAARHRHPFHRRAGQFLGRGLDRATRRRGDHQRLRRQSLLSEQNGGTRRDGGLSGKGVQPAAAVGPVAAAAEPTTPRPATGPAATARRRAGG